MPNGDRYTYFDETTQKYKIVYDGVVHPLGFMYKEDAVNALNNMQVLKGEDLRTSPPEKTLLG